MHALLIAVSLLSGKVPVATPAAAPGHDIVAGNGDYAFRYSYPAAAEHIRALKTRLDEDAARQKEAIVGEARAGRDEAKDGGRPFGPYESTTEWKVVTDLPNWLSLSGFSGEYTGGAHPNHEPTALLWDKARSRQVEATDLFVTKAAFSAAVRERFCAELNRQRANKRGAPVDPTSTDPDDVCLNPADTVVILGSADHAHFTRVGFLMGPYAAGPYVEGDYEVTLAVTPALLSAVRPEYRDAFAVPPTAQASK